MRACKYVKSFGFCPRANCCVEVHPSLCIDGNACSVFRCELSHTEPLCTSWSTCTVYSCPRRHGPGRWRESFHTDNFQVQDGYVDHVDETDAESENGGEQQMNNNSQSMCCSPSKPSGLGKRGRDSLATCEGGSGGDGMGIGMEMGMGMGTAGSSVLKKRLLAVSKDTNREDDDHRGLNAPTMP